MRNCPACSVPNDDPAIYCSHCGAPLPTIPLGPTLSAQYEGTSGAAIASLICGIFFLIFPAAVAAVILGHISHSQIRKSAGRLKGDGMSLTGMILGYAGVVLFPVMLIASLMAIGFYRTRHVVPANSVTAVQSLRSISDACGQYYKRYQGYPTTLMDLGPPASGDAPSPSAAGLLDADLISGQKDGYVFSYGPLRPRSNGRFDAYNAEADPIYARATGASHFHVDETGVMREARSEVAGRTSPVLGGAANVQPSPQ